MKLTKYLQANFTVAIVFITLCMSACSMRIMYDYLDWILPMYVDDYVTLTDQQENIFDRATIDFLKWHRTKELPRYEQFVVSFKEAQLTPMSQQQVLLFFDEIKFFWTALVSESLPSLLELFADLNETQLQEINAALVDNIKELQEKYDNRTKSQRRQNMRDKMTDAVDDWLGEVTDEQEELIKKWSETRKDTTGGRLIYRDNWRQKFMGLLRNQQTLNYIDDMSTFLLEPEKMYSSSYQQAVLENRHHFAQFLADLSTTFTPQQRQHLQHELTGIIDDLKELSDQENQAQP